MGMSRGRTGVLSSWESFALRGHPMAQYMIGAACAEGVLYIKSDAEAFRWFTRAVNTKVRIHLDTRTQIGGLYGRYALGMAYLEGRGAEKNEDQGLKWLRSASAFLVEAHDALEDYLRRKESTTIKLPSIDTTSK
jgi:TPR repeat protein